MPSTIPTRENLRREQERKLQMARKLIRGGRMDLELGFGNGGERNRDSHAPDELDRSVETHDNSTCVSPNRIACHGWSLPTILFGMCLEGAGLVGHDSKRFVRDWYEQQEWR